MLNKININNKISNQLEYFKYQNLIIIKVSIYSFT